jgi:hypothetical protein
MKNLFIFLSSILLFTSCRKKDSPTPEPAPGTTGSTTNYTYGSMDLVYYTFYNGNTFAGNDSAASAIFFSDPLSAPASLLDAGTVTMNGTSLQYLSNTYRLFSATVHSTSSAWAVSGSTVVPAINYTLTPNFPGFTGNAQLPDSFSISSGITISILGVSNFGTNSIYVQIDDNMGGMVYKTIQPGNFSCTFSHSELASLQPSTYASITVNLGNSVIQTFNGKNYGFGSTIVHRKNAIKIKS